MEESVDCLEVQEIPREDLTTHIFKLNQKIRHLHKIIASRDEVILSLQAELEAARGMPCGSSPEIVTSCILPDPFGPSDDASALPQTKFFIRITAAVQADTDERETAELRILANSYPPLVSVKVTSHQQAAFDPSTPPPRRLDPSPARPPGPPTPSPARRQLQA